MTADTIDIATQLSLKEWAAAVHALLDGRQSILLRKGGIHEKAFVTPERGGGFLLFPTVAHAHLERTRPEHRDLIARGADDATDDTLTIRAAVHLVDTVEVTRPERLPELEDLHIWTSESIKRDRVDFRPVKPLTVMIVQTVPVGPVTIPRLDTYGGCTSWIDLLTTIEIPQPTPDEGLAQIARRVKDTVG